MSADNWTICPRCKHKQEAAQARLEEKIADSYGKVPAEEYLAMREKFLNPDPLDGTLREDYAVGINLDDDTFYVEYECSCTVCHFHFTHSHIESLNKPV